MRSITRGEAIQAVASPRRASNDRGPCLLILLVRHTDFRSRAGLLLSGSKFSHASIGFGYDPGTFYSFVFKGFRTELARILAARTPFAPCRLYRIPCSSEQEDDARRMVNSFIRQKESLGFNHLGLLLAYLHIPYARKNRFFCSQFVASVLNRSCQIGTKRWAKTCLPDGLSTIPSSELVYEGPSHALPSAPIREKAEGMQTDQAKGDMRAKHIVSR